MASDAAYMRKRRALGRKLLNALKNAPCKDCGNRFPPYVMDFDHVRGEKKFNIGTYPGLPLAALMLEAEKCDVVCSNCHRLRTHKNRVTPFE